MGAQPEVAFPLTDCRGYTIAGSLLGEQPRAKRSSARVSRLKSQTEVKRARLEPSVASWRYQETRF